MGSRKYYQPPPPPPLPPVVVPKLRPPGLLDETHTLVPVFQVGRCAYYLVLIMPYTNRACFRYLELEDILVSFISHAINTFSTSPFLLTTYAPRIPNSGLSIVVEEEEHCITDDSAYLHKAELLVGIRAAAFLCSGFTRSPLTANTTLSLLMAVVREGGTLSTYCTREAMVHE